MADADHRIHESRAKRGDGNGVHDVVCERRFLVLLFEHNKSSSLLVWVKKLSNPWQCVRFLGNAAPGKRCRNQLDTGGGKSSIHELDPWCENSGSVESGQVAEPNQLNPGDGSTVDKVDSWTLVGGVVCSSLFTSLS